MKSFKRAGKGFVLSAALLAAGMTLLTGISGCSKSSETAKDGPVTVTIWRPQDQEGIEKWYEEKIAEFNAAHEGQIVLKQEVIIRANSFAYEDKVNAAVTTNTLPDILMVDGPNISNYAENGIIVPIDEYISAEDKADFLDSTITQNTYDGKLYCVANTESSVALYFNKKMCDEAGIVPPTTLEDAWTWDEFYEAAKKLTKPGVSGANIIMDKGEGIPYVLEQFWISNGTDFVSADGSKADGYVNSPEGIEAASYLNRFIQEKIADIDPINYAFHTGKCALLLGGCWEVSVLNSQYPDLEYGITYFPVAPGGKATSPTGDWSYGITKNAQNMEAAAEALNWLTNRENAAAYARAIAKPPARKSGFEMLTQFNEYPQSVFKEQLLNTGTPRPRTPSYTVLSPRFSEAMMNIFTGADIKESLDAVAKAVDDDYNRNYGE